MNGRTLTEQVKIRIEPDLKRKLENIAKRETVPVSIVHRRALRAYVDKEANRK